MASYLGEFFVQFFHIAWLGSLLLAFMIALAQVQSWRVVCSVKTDTDDAWYPLSFIPAVCFWAFLCDAGNLVSALVAFLLICEVAVIVCKSKCDKLWLPAIALAYYLPGPMAFILAVVAIVDIFTASSPKRAAKVLDGCLFPSCGIACLNDTGRKALKKQNEDFYPVSGFRRHLSCLICICEEALLKGHGTHICVRLLRR